MIKLPQSQRPASILGLAFDGNRLGGVVLRRRGDSVESAGTFAADLTLDPLTVDPELVGREIRNHLDAAEVRERRCVVCLPLRWILTLQTKVPELNPEDAASYLQLEAERGFPYGLDSMLTAVSVSGAGSGESQALQLAVPRDHVDRLERALRAARLVPVSFSLGLPALQSTASGASGGVLALEVGDRSAGLAVMAAGGVTTLRTLDHAVEADGAARGISQDEVVREIRITLGQLPAAIRSQLRVIRIFGAGTNADLLEAGVRARSSSFGLPVERVAHGATAALGVAVPLQTEITPALCLAARYLAGQPATFELLPPRVSLWRQYADKYTSRKLGYVGSAVALVLLLVGLAFGIQQVRMSQLQARWKLIGTKVREVESIQQKVIKYQPWFDDSFRCLSILGGLSLAFPEDSTVTAKTIDMRDGAPVSCGGTARDNKSLMGVIERLRASTNIADVQVRNMDQVRGGSPVQFTFNFQWVSGNQP